MEAIAVIITSVVAVAGTVTASMGWLYQRGQADGRAEASREAYQAKIDACQVQTHELVQQLATDRADLADTRAELADTRIQLARLQARP